MRARSKRGAVKEARTGGAWAYLLAYGLKNGAKVGPGVGTVKDTRCSGVQNSLALLYSVGRYAAPAADPVPVVVRAVL